MAAPDSTGATKTDADVPAGSPIIVDLGKRKKKLVRRLRKGTGKLMDEVQAALSEIHRAGKIGAGAQPIIVIVTQKTKNRRMPFC